MALHVSVSVNDRQIIRVSAVNTGRTIDGEHVYEYVVHDDGPSRVNKTGVVRHDRTEGAASLARKVLEKTRA